MNRNGRPNIVFLMLDTLSADSLRLYGGDIRMPNVEGIARRGTVYRKAIAPGTYTLTSHVSIFTGKRVRSLRQLNKNPLKDTNESIDPLFLKNKYIKQGDIALANKLSYLGYRTSLFSNNPFITNSTGLSNGFSYVKNIFMENKLNYHKTTLRIIGNDFMRENLTKLACYISAAIPKEGLDKLYTSLRNRLNEKVCRETGAFLLDQGAALTNAVIDDYLSKVKAEGNFIFANYMEAHEGYPTQMITDRDVSQDRWMYVSGILDSEDTGVLRKAYARRVEYLDKKIGRLMLLLKYRGVLDNAVVVLTSDHGQAFMEHGQLYHTLFPYNEISHVPLVAARYLDGKQTSERKTVEKAVSLTSLYDSLLDIGYGKSETLNGSMTTGESVFSDHTGMLDVWDMRLLGMLKDRIKNAEIIYKAKMKYNTFATAVYSGGYKLMHYYGGRMKDELYNLEEDPKESVNIIGEKRETARELLHRA